jgi:hypothetical protein
MIVETIVGGVFLYNYLKGKSNNDDTTKTELYSDFDNLFVNYANVYGINAKMLKRIAFVESTVGNNSRVKKGLLNPNDIEGSKSTDGKSWGIMQMTLTTARDYDSTATAQKLNNADYSIMLASKHIKMLASLFPNDERSIVMSYNHGQGNQKKFLLAEKNGTLKASEYLAGRDYYQKYLDAKKIVG